MKIVFIELPDVGRNVDQGEDAAVIESVKAAGEIKSPVSGEVVEVNDALNDNPEKVNEEPEGDGWVYKIKVSDADELNSLKDEDAYKAYVESLA